jgi:hypothetical protein
MIRRLIASLRRPLRHLRATRTIVAARLRTVARPISAVTIAPAFFFPGLRWLRPSLLGRATGVGTMFALPIALRACAAISVRARLTRTIAGGTMRIALSLGPTSLIAFRARTAFGPGLVALRPAAFTTRRPLPIARRTHFIWSQLAVAVAVEFAQRIAGFREFVGIDSAIMICIEHPKESGRRAPAFAARSRATFGPGTAITRRLGGT